MSKDYSVKKGLSTPTDGLQPGDSFKPSGVFSFTAIPDPILTSFPGLSASAKIVYGVLLRYEAIHGESFPKNKTIASDAGVSSRTVNNCIKELKNEDLIAVLDRFDEEGGQTSYLYQFLWHENFECQQRGQ